MIIVSSMHQRKEKMADLADAFIALPGGFGTLEELSEILTWIQLRIIQKPVALLNVKGFFDHFLAQLDHMAGESFLSLNNRRILIHADTPEKLVEILFKSRLSVQTKFMDKDKT